jgi:translocation protein SEC63
MSIQDFMNLPADQRKKRTTGPGLLSEAQYKDVAATASQLPFLHVEKTFFKVVGERFVTPNSLVQFVVKARIIPPGSVNVPPVKESDLEDIDAPEGDVAAITGRKDDKSGEKPIQPPLAHAPYFARDRSPRWHVFLADSKQGKIAVPPFTFSTFDKPLLDESGKPTFNVQTLKMQFGAPPQAGRYTFVMHLICDSYVGMDTKMEVTLVVEEASKAEEMGDDDEISEPDEGMSFLRDLKSIVNPEPDTVAGQLRTLKSGSLPGATKSKKRYNDSSDGSDTEGDVNSESETDTDTDTDDE